jgi:NADH-quinone oxidoreductase subunit A
MVAEYIMIWKFFLLSCLIVFFLFSLSFFLVVQVPDLEKISTYECGFNPYGNARSKVEINFFLVGILFIIFDLEISFLFPWFISFYSLSILGVITMFFFITLLTLGYAYEWSKGVLEIGINNKN